MANVKLNIQHISIGDIKPAAYNPRHMTDKQRDGLEYSIDEFGLVEPIVWNKRTGNIVGGHQRYIKLLKDQITSTDVVVVDLDDKKEKALNIALNHHGISGDFEMSELASLLEELADEDMFSKLNFDELEQPEWDDIPEVKGNLSLQEPKDKIVVELDKSKSHIKDEIIAYIEQGISEHWPGHGIKLK